MLRFVSLTVGGGVLAALVLVQPFQVGADDSKTMSIEAVMKKLHGKNGSHKVIGKSLDAPDMDWKMISEHAKIYSEVTTLLDKSTPEKGDKKAWDKLCAEYAKDAKALSDAATKKEKNTLKTVFGKLKESCDTCHENHR